ncbi:TetR/AcrR family transcriptional regulator [Nonomuraea sp. NPDC047897]|uniref:TetR/AcrR family transcriptional regulator n=1 Tax=Nonomuraea sp. NPDC047897 TaxID=3364346 RepID=UPI00371656E5
MGRPPRHDADRLLDAAVALAADGGPGAVTAAAVAREAGAPSGSVYHRFPGRSALLAALWLRTVERFQDGFLAALETVPAIEAAPAAARHVVAWSRAHPAECGILLYGAADFDERHWPAAARERLKLANGRVAAALRTLAGRLGRDDAERIVIATVDLPYAVVRRHLASGHGIPASAESTVADCAAALLDAS